MKEDKYKDITNSKQWLRSLQFPTTSFALTTLAKLPLPFWIKSDKIPMTWLPLLPSSTWFKSFADFLKPLLEASSPIPNSMKTLSQHLLTKTDLVLRFSCCWNLNRSKISRVFLVVFSWWAVVFLRALKGTFQF